MQIIYELDHNAYSPVRAHDNDAGFDLMCKEDQILEPNKANNIDTGLVTQAQLELFWNLLMSQKFLKVIKLPSS